MAKRILVVEDNPDMLDSLAVYLKSQGLEVVLVSSAEEAIDVVDEQVIDAAIVDINLPGKSGFDLVEYIREEGHTFPLIAMTAREAIDDKLRGFNLGLTDYVVKPFDVKELAARLNVHIKNVGKNDGEAVTIKSFAVNPNKLELKINNQQIALTQLEFRIIYILMSRADTIVALDDVIEYAWGESEELVNPPIRIHIANVRKKIGDTNYEIIRTIPGSGYIFNSEAIK